MQTATVLRCTLAAVFALACPAAGAATTLHVAPDGSDKNPGTAAKPLATPCPYHRRHADVQHSGQRSA